MNIETLKRGFQNPKTAFYYVYNQCTSLVSYPYRSAVTAITSRLPYGEDLFAREWDVLIVLDACRVDAMRKVQNEYQFIDTVDSIRSKGSQSIEWMAATFDKRWETAISRTALVTANPHSKTVFEDNLGGGSDDDQRKASSTVG